MARLRPLLVLPLLAVGLGVGCKPAAREAMVTPSAAASPGAPAPASPLPPLPASVPLQAGPAGPIVPAPPASALPSAPPLPVRRLADPGEAYAYLDRAYDTDNAFADVPPDYAFDYDGVNPWAWQAADGATEFAEPVPGGYRRYYYQPGAATPYFVADSDYGYGYAEGALVIVYDRYGRALPPGARGPWDGFAGRYYRRGTDLYAARLRGRRGAFAANWSAARSAFRATPARWDNGLQRDPDWRGYHQAHADEAARHWRPERDRREAAFRQAPADQRPVMSPAFGARDQRMARVASDYGIVPARAFIGPEGRPAQAGPSHGGRDAERDGPERRRDLADRSPVREGGDRVEVLRGRSLSGGHGVEARSGPRFGQEGGVERIETRPDRPERLGDPRGPMHRQPGFVPHGLPDHGPGGRGLPGTGLRSGDGAPPNSGQRSGQGGEYRPGGDPESGRLGSGRLEGLGRPDERPVAGGGHQTGGNHAQAGGYSGGGHPGGGHAGGGDHPQAGHPSGAGHGDSGRHPH